MAKIVAVNKAFHISTSVLRDKKAYGDTSAPWPQSTMICPCNVSIFWKILANTGSLVLSYNKGS